MSTALVVVHLSSLDTYTESLPWPAGEELADAIIDAVQTHQGGPVYIVDQGWSLGRKESRPRERVLNALEEKRVTWIRFDEATQDWARFLPRLARRLRAKGVTRVAVAGLWYDPAETEGCASYVATYLRKFFLVRVLSGAVGCV